MGGGRWRDAADVGGSGRRQNRGGEQCAASDERASTHAEASEACARRPRPERVEVERPLVAARIDEYAASVCVIRRTLMPAIVFVATLTPIA